MSSHLENLKKLTIEKESKKVFEYLNQSSTDFYKSNVEKGNILELYIEFLFESCGYHVKNNGGKGDRGVDLIITLDKIIEPIMYMQVKNHQKVVNHDMIINDMSKFNSEYGKNKKIDEKFAYFSLNGFTKEVIEDTNQSYKTMSFEDIEYLILNFNNKEFNKKKILSTSTLLPHNLASYKKVKEMALKKDEVAVIQPTGTGKMYIINELCLDFFNNPSTKKAMVVAPSNFILNKIQELNLFPLNKKIIYKTYSSLLEMSFQEINELDLKEIYFDEMHRLGAKEWGNKAKKIIELSNAKIYGFTATDNRMDGINIAEEIFKKNIANQFTLTEAIVQGLLKSPKYVTSLYSIDEEINNASDKINNLPKLNDKEKKKYITNLNANFVNWEENHGISTIFDKHLKEHNHFKNNGKAKLIVFCKNIEHAMDMEIEVKKRIHKTKLFKRINTFVVTSENTKIENEEFLDKFENNKKINECDLLFSVDQLNEGIHINDITGVVFFRQSYSKIIYFQQLGRALSVNNKETPIVFDFVNNFNALFREDINKDFNKINEKEENRKKRIGINQIKKEIKIDIIDETKDIVELIDHLTNPRKNPEERLNQLKEHIKTYKEYPNYKNNQSLKIAIDNIFNNNFKGCTEEQIQEFKHIKVKYYKPKKNMPEDRLNQLKEHIQKYNDFPNSQTNLNLQLAINKIFKNNFEECDEGIKKEFKILKEIYRPTFNTPQYWLRKLKTYTEVYDIYPPSKSETTISIALNKIFESNFEGCTEEQIMDFKYFKERFYKEKENIIEEKNKGRTFMYEPEERLNQLKKHIKKYRDYPNSKNYPSLKLAIDNIFKNDFERCTEEVKKEFIMIKEKYKPTYDTPQYWLKTLREYIKQHKFYPPSKSKTSINRALTYIYESNFEECTKEQIMDFKYLKRKYTKEKTKVKLK